MHPIDVDIKIYICRCSSFKCVRAAFRVKGVLVSDVKMGCNQAGFNYRGLSGRQSWTRPSMNRNTHVSKPRGRCSRESWCCKGSESCTGPLKSEAWSNCDSRSSHSYWMCHFHLQLFRTTGETTKREEGPEGNCFILEPKKKKGGGHMLGKSVALLLSFISSGFGRAVLFLQNPGRFCKYLSFYYKVRIVRKIVGWGSFI